MRRSQRPFAPPRSLPRLALTALAGLASFCGAAPALGACPIVDPCDGGATPLPAGGDGAQLDVGRDSCFLVTSAEASPEAPRVYRNVNVHDGGKLFFLETPNETIDFRVSSLLVEQGGLVQAGSEDCPFGSKGGRLMLGLWGEAQGFGVATEEGPRCATHGGQCYDPSRLDDMCCTGSDPEDPCTTRCDPDAASGPERAVLNSYFEGYSPLDFDGTADDPNTGRNFFGFKVVGVAYGGRLRLFGKKGATYDGPDDETSAPSCDLPDDYFSADAWAQKSATSWVRLRADATPESAVLALDRRVDWSAGDRLVLGTTDWYPSHTEVVTISRVSDCSGCDSSCPAGNGRCSDVELTEPPDFEHNGTLTTVPAKLTNTNHGNPNDAIDTRAAVGLLSRSITVYSLGDGAQDPFPAAGSCRLQDQFPGGYDGATDPANPGCFFGGHVIARQGFGAFEVQGVEFRQLGQGGRMGHYPVHFHLAKDAAYADAYLRDSSIWDSNTRFAVLHGTHGVELSRNVGYLSLGHGFYLEDGSEIDNALCHNLGVSARGSLVEYFEARGDAPDCSASFGDESASLDCRFVPPILDHAMDRETMGSDTLMPVTFWSMNAYNEMVGNKAVGVHGYGSCHWLLGSGVSGVSLGLTWASQWNEQRDSQEKSSAGEADYANFNWEGNRQAPVKSFRGNSCSTAAYALQTTADIAPTDADNSGFQPAVNPYYRDLAAAGDGAPEFHRPRVTGDFKPRRFPDLDPASLPESVGCPPGAPAALTEPFANSSKYCVTTVIDHFSTSHNWSEVNFGSIWLRPEFYIFSNGKVADQLFGGLGFVSGGVWSQAPPGYYTLTQNGLFAGTTQPVGSDGGPLGPEYSPDDPACSGSCCATGHCVLPSEGIGLFTGGFNPKRMITIYDGPFYADGNVFFDIESVACKPSLDDPESCRSYLSTFQPGCTASGCPETYPYSQGLPGEMVVANAAVGWKQTNAFYYPPAFAFLNTAFDRPSSQEPLSRRHVVIDQYQPYLRNAPDGNDLRDFRPLGETFPNSITPVDFSTILNDLDGTFNGLVVNDARGGLRSTHTAAVSENRFFDAPAQTFSGVPSDPVNAGQECESFGSRTSAYEFVTTVVGKAKSTGDEWFVDTADWSGDGPFAAVPIYRQLLMPGEEASCGDDDGRICDGESWGCDRGTFMTGGQAGQAPYLTMNEGVYYIDTGSAISQGGPTPECVRNTEGFFLPRFEPGESYVVWQLFAKPHSRIEYQLYVGDGFEPSSHLTWVRVHPHIFHGDSSANDLQIVPALGERRFGDYRFDRCTGVLEVVLDHQRVADDFALDARSEDLRCLPSNVCRYELEDPRRADSGRCVTSLPESDPLHGQTDAACKSWVTATSGTTPASDASLGDLSLADCPEGGCIGVLLRLPDDFRPATYAEKGLPYAGCFGTRRDLLDDDHPKGDDVWTSTLAALSGPGINNNCPVPPKPKLCDQPPSHACGEGCCEESSPPGLGTRQDR